MMIYFRPTFDDNRRKSRGLALAVHGRHTILCGVIEVTPGVTDRHVTHTTTASLTASRERCAHLLISREWTL